MPNLTRHLPPSVKPIKFEPSDYDAKFEGVLAGDEIWVGSNGTRYLIDGKTREIINVAVDQR